MSVLVVQITGTRVFDRHRAGAHGRDVAAQLPIPPTAVRGAVMAIARRNAPRRHLSCVGTEARRRECAAIWCRSAIRVRRIQVIVVPIGRRPGNRARTDASVMRDACCGSSARCCGSRIRVPRAGHTVGSIGRRDSDDARFSCVRADDDALMLAAHCAASRRRKQ